MQRPSSPEALCWWMAACRSARLEQPHYARTCKADKSRTRHRGDDIDRKYRFGLADQRSSAFCPLLATWREQSSGEAAPPPGRLNPIAPTPMARTIGVFGNRVA